MVIIMNNKLTKNSATVAVAAVAAIIGVIIYIITSVTGYLAASTTNMAPIICTVAAVILLGAVVFAGEKLSETLKDILIILASALLLVSFYFFIISRVPLAADVYFIPVNYPAAEATALHISIVGAVFYLVSYIAIIAAAFTKKKDNA